MKARRRRINKNCKWRLSVNLQSVLARIPPKITLYWLLFKYNYVGCLLLLMFSIDCCLQSKGTRISSRQQDFWFPEHQKLDGWRKAANMLAQTSQWNRVRKAAHSNSVKQKYKQILVARKKEISDGYMAYLLTQETSAIEQNSSSRDGKKEDRKEAVTEVSMKLCLVFVCQDVILWSLSMKDIN